MRFVNGCMVLLGIAALIGSFYLMRFRYRECKAFGHTTTYCWGGR